MVASNAYLVVFDKDDKQERKDIENILLSKGYKFVKDTAKRKAIVVYFYVNHKTKVVHTMFMLFNELDNFFAICPKIITPKVFKSLCEDGLV